MSEYTMKKIDNSKGSSNPFVARMFIGILELRKDAYQFLPGSQEEKNKKIYEFDEFFSPLHTSMDVSYEKVLEILRLITEYKKKVKDGKVIYVQNNTTQITETIDRKVNELFKDYIINIHRAFNELKPLLKFLQIDIDCLYMKDLKFNEGILTLIGLGMNDLADVLRQHRLRWSENFKKLRVDIEHYGYNIEEIGFKKNIENSSFIMVEPNIDNRMLTQYIIDTTNEVISFIENMLIYAISKMLPTGIIICEIPENLRDPKLPEKFKISINPNLFPNDCVEWHINDSKYEFITNTI